MSNATSPLAPLLNKGTSPLVGEDVPKGQEGRTRGDTFTPSELEDYAACPFGFYIKQILEIEPPPESGPELTPAEIGILLHRLLERYFCEKTPADFSNEIAAAFASLQENRGNLLPALVERQQRRVERTFQAFIEEEARRSRTTSLRPAYHEWSFGEDRCLEIADESGRPIRIRGRVDRIDVDREKKSFLIIDYKTGSHKISGPQILAGASLQIPLYLLAVRELLLPDYRPIGGLYYHLSDLSLDSGVIHAERVPDGFALRPSTVVPAPRWEGLLETTKEKVRSIVRGIRRQEFPAASQPCRPWCPYQDVCRLAVSQVERLRS